MMKDSDLQNFTRLLVVSLQQPAADDAEKLDFLQELTGEQWQEIRKELEAQALTPLVSDSVERASIDPAIKLEFTKRTAVHLRSYHRVMAAQSALMELLGRHQIRAAILKGTSAARYYPRPELRVFGDIDVLVLPKDFDKAARLLEESGYRNESNAAYTRHMSFKAPNGTEVELHRYFSSSANEKQNTLLDSWLFEQLERIEDGQTINVGGYLAPTLPALENGLIFLSHINQHLSGGLGLRQIIDWMLYVRAELDDAFWKNQFQERAGAIGMETLAITVTRMCQLYLGLTRDITWCADADQELAEELMQYILAKGNFGGKEGYGEAQKTAEIAHHFARPGDAVHYLTEIGMIHMAEAGLKPRKSVAWLYQVGHLLHKTVKRGDDVRLSENLKKGAQESKLLKKLKITRL